MTQILWGVISVDLPLSNIFLKIIFELECVPSHIKHVFKKIVSIHRAPMIGPFLKAESILTQNSGVSRYSMGSINPFLIIIWKIAYLDFTMTI